MVPSGDRVFICERIRNKQKVSQMEKRFHFIRLFVCFPYFNHVVVFVNGQKERKGNIIFFLFTFLYEINKKNNNKTKNHNKLA